MVRKQKKSFTGLVIIPGHLLTSGQRNSGAIAGQQGPSPIGLLQKQQP